MIIKTDKIRDERISKIDEIRKLEIDPYPSLVKKVHSVAQTLEMLGSEVSIVGRMRSFRLHGKIAFADLQDQSGMIQVFFAKDLLGDKQYKLVKLLDTGDFISVEGEVVKTTAGEISVKPSKLSILSKAIRPLPNQWYGLKDVETRYRKRYLDMVVNPKVMENFKIRSKTISALRKYLDERGFTEVETPTLQAVYGGGFARPFVTYHNVLDTDYYLRISDEMYLKRLIVGGLEKVYEITKVFRNEGVDVDHNPEFTMFEAMIAYENYSYGMDIIEDLFEYMANEAVGSIKFEWKGHVISLKKPWNRLTVVEAVEKYTKIKVSEWKSIKDVKKAVSSLQFGLNKLAELNKMQTIGEIIAFIFEEKVEEKLIEPTFIYDYPVEISPLAKKCKDPRYTQRFEMFIAGLEMGNNYTELNDPIDLYQRFIEEKKREKAGFAEAHQTDYDYLTAIEHGFPPTCGIAIGIDRLIMLFTGSDSIREVIPFPTLRPVVIDEEN